MNSGLGAALLQAAAGRLPRVDFLRQAEVEIQTKLAGKRILLTGGAGSIAEEASALLTLHAPTAVVCPADIVPIVRGAYRSLSQPLDIRSRRAVFELCRAFRPDVMLHLAAEKYVDECARRPDESWRVNVEGSQILLDAAPRTARVVLASTCKSIHPHSEYGEQKRTAEDTFLSGAHANAAVVRFYNVVDSAGNVFEIWRRADARGESLPVIGGCERYFLTAREAATLLLVAATRSGNELLVLHPGDSDVIERIVDRLYPTNLRRCMSLRPGERAIEPLKGEDESWIPVPGIPYLFTVSRREDKFRGAMSR